MNKSGERDDLTLKMTEIFTRLELWFRLNSTKYLQKFIFLGAICKFFVAKIAASVIKKRNEIKIFCVLLTVFTVLRYNEQKEIKL